jgi:hypothetical protein
MYIENERIGQGKESIKKYFDENEEKYKDLIKKVIKEN